MTLYDTIGRGYAAFRRPDPRIAAAIEAALGDAAGVVNIGAGAGSYEPPGRTVLAVEPSEVMIRQRPAPPRAAPCVRGSAEALRLETASVDAAMAVLSAHHWTDLERGLREMARVARRRVVLLTWVPPPIPPAPTTTTTSLQPPPPDLPVPDAPPFWLTADYFPEILAHDRTIFPPAGALAAMLGRAVGGPVRLTPVLVPHDCSDGFLGAYWRRPEAYLSDDARSAISSFSRIDAAPGLARLRADLASGRWAERNRALLTLEALDVGYRLVCGEKGGSEGTRRVP